MNVHMARQLLEGERDRLLAIRHALGREQVPDESEEESFAELSPLDQHQADVASEVFEHEMEESIVTRIDADLREIQDALARLDVGTYGRCQTCRSAIPDDRLVVVPATRYCADHEALWEGRRMSFSLPDTPPPDRGAFAGDVAEREARSHLEFLPEDDDIDERIELSTEEAALHVNAGPAFNEHDLDWADEHRQ